MTLQFAGIDLSAGQWLALVVIIVALALWCFWILLGGE